MEKRRLTNSSEALTYRALDKCLKDTPFRVFAKLPSAEVIGPGIGERLNKADRKFLNASHFDFVVYNEKMLPEFAVEFDGPHHEFDEEQKRRDVRKNRLCREAQLALIRVSDIHLEEHDRTTLLEYMIGRFVAWREEKPKIMRGIQKHIESLAPEELPSLTEGGFLDPSIDPNFIFDRQRPFPATPSIVNLLFKRFGIFSDLVSGGIAPPVEGTFPQMRCWAFGFGEEFGLGDDYVSKYSYGVFRATKADGLRRLGWILGRVVAPGTEILHHGKITFRLQWTIPTAHDYDSTLERPFEYYLRTGKLPYAYQDLPGVHLPDVAGRFCEYLAYKQIYKWAFDNLAHKT